ncbi:MAG: MmgE/PrpD family protein [Oscillospiraceae bacterium]|nr:MmgE/PrpD family protein [Oscillospiraceae bacterium]
MANVTQAFADYLFNKSIQITDEIRGRADMCMDDYLAVTAAGAAKNRKRWVKLLERIPCGSAELVGYDKRADGRTAALINGFNAHSLELDDGQRFAMIHLGASVISAIKAASDENEITDDQIRTGIIMGYEAACRAAIAMQPSHKNRGYHTAGTCGTIGSAVGVAFALGLNTEQMIRVLTCAAGSAAGMLEIQEQRSEIKPYNIGRAAMDGLAAAYMGFTDYATPDDMFGGERGFYRMFADEWDPDKLTENTDYFEIERIYVKPYASCRHSHSAVEAAIKLHSLVDAERIESVEVRTYKLGVKGHDHTEIQGIASAKLSTPYAVAAGLLYGRADLSVFEPLDDRAVRLASKVKVAEDPALTAESPQKRIAIVRVLLDDGTERTARVDYAKGDPENPMTGEEIAEKKRMLLAYSADNR